VDDDAEQLWIRSFAVWPRRLSDGRWVWLRSYEWRWAAFDDSLPQAVQTPLLETRGVALRVLEAAEGVA
jgi:hypothetical protein